MSNKSFPYSLFKKWRDKKNIKQKKCDHPGVSFPLAESDKPGHMRCHFCDRVRVTYNTGKPIDNTLHTYTKSFWVKPDWKLEQALETSPCEFGDLRIEKWLRNNGYI